MDLSLSPPKATNPTPLTSTSVFEEIRAGLLECGVQDMAGSVTMVLTSSHSVINTLVTDIRGWVDRLDRHFEREEKDRTFRFILHETQGLAGAVNTLVETNQTLAPAIKDLSANFHNLTTELRSHSHVMENQLAHRPARSSNMPKPYDRRER